jgi:hypothetical protein
MTSFSVTDAAFAGFRVVREHYRALIFWVPLAFVIALTISAIFIGVGGRIIDTQALQADPSQALTLMNQMAPAFLATSAAAFIANAIIYAAMNRVILFPQDSAFGFLRLGADELRQLGLMLLLTILFAGIYLGLVIVAALLAVVATLGGKILGLIVMAMVVATAICLMVFLAVRLSLAAAVTFDTKRVGLRGSWTLTAGQFWPILGAYLLAGALTLVVLILAWLVEIALGAVLTGGDMKDFVGNSPDTLPALVTAPSLLRLALGSVISALIWPLILTPPAAIYSRLKPGARGGL